MAQGGTPVEAQPSTLNNLSTHRANKPSVDGPVLLRTTQLYMICTRGPKNERNCNILLSERPFFLLHINLETHFHQIYKKAAERVNLLRRIHSSIDTFSAQRIYQSMNMSIITYCGYNGLGWSEFHKRMIRSIEKRSLEIIQLSFTTCCKGKRVVLYLAAS